MIAKIIENKAFEFISNNLSLLLGIPTLIGGIKQFHDLTSLSPLLYRFFSFSQLIIDGFIILIELITFYFVFTFYEIFVEFLTNPSGSQSKKAFKIFSCTLFIILILILSTFMILKYGYNLDKSNYYLKFFIYLGIIIIILNIINLSIALKKGESILFFLALILGFTFFPKANNSIENFSILTKKISEKYPKSKLAYFNDQYIFYQISKDKYLVKKIDDLFESDVN